MHLRLATRSNVLEVPEDSVIMVEVLRFIKTGKVIENLKEIACKLVLAAEKYHLGELKEMCLDSIVGSLSTENVLQALMAADRLTESTNLKTACIQMIAR